MLRKMGSVYPALEKDEPPEGRPKEGDLKEELGQERAQEDWKQHREEVIPDHDCEGLVCPFVIEDDDGDEQHGQKGTAVCACFFLTLDVEAWQRHSK